MFTTPRLGKFLGLEFDAHPQLYHEFVDFVLERCGMQYKEGLWWQPTTVASIACQADYKIQSGEPVVVLRWHGDTVKRLLAMRKRPFNSPSMREAFQRMKKRQRQDRLDAERKSRARDKSWLSPSKLGGSFGLAAAVAGVVTNYALRVAGLQERVDGKWQPTVTGHLAAREEAWNHGSDSGTHLVWQVGITTQLLVANGVDIDPDALVRLYEGANKQLNRAKLAVMRDNARMAVIRKHYKK